MPKNNILDILEDSDGLSLPKTIGFDDHKDFITTIKACFQNYRERLIENQDTLFDFEIKSKTLATIKTSSNEAFIQEVDSVIKSIEDIYTSYLKGKIKDANKIFEKLNFEKYFVGQTQEGTKMFERGSRFYRIRCCETAIDKPLDLFHVPFEKRHIVSSQRYSIPGLPCLYLGSSIKVCLEELKIESLETTKAIKLENNKQIKFINLIPLNITDIKQRLATLEPQQVSEVVNIIKNYAIFFPLFICLYHKINYKTENPTFKIDYIMTQMIFYWLMGYRGNKNGENQVLADVVGVMYLSIFYSKTHKVDEHINFAIPTYSTGKSTGYCDELSTLFNMSAVVDYKNHSSFFDKANDKNIIRFERMLA
jgi:hypothetical protein